MAKPPEKTTEKPFDISDIPAFLRRQPDATDAPAADTPVVVEAAPSEIATPDNLVDVRKFLPGREAPAQSEIDFSAPPAAAIADAPVVEVIEPAPAAQRSVIALRPPFTIEDMIEAPVEAPAEEEFTSTWRDHIPTPIIRMVYGKQAAIMSTFSAQRRAHASILAGDNQLKQAVESSLQDEKLGTLTFKGIESLFRSPVLNANTTTFKILMNGTGQLGIAHPVSLGDKAVQTLQTQLAKRKVTSGELVAQTMSDIGSIGAKSGSAVKAAWPALNDYFNAGKIRGEAVTKFFGDSGAMARQSPEMRSEILAGLKAAIIKQVIINNRPNLQAAFEAVKSAASANPAQGLAACLEIQPHLEGKAEYTGELLEDAAAHFVEPLVDPDRLFELFETRAFEDGQESTPGFTEVVALRNLLIKADESGIVANRSYASLVEVFDNVWIAHEFNQQAEREITAAQMQADADIGAIKRRLNIKTDELMEEIEGRTAVTTQRYQPVFGVTPAADNI